MNSVVSDGRRINEVLIGYWRQIRGRKPYPLESDFDIEAVADIWDSCFLVRREALVTGVTPPYSYLYLGSSLIDAYGGDLTDREICERLVFPSSMPLVHRFDEVSRTGEPVLDESEFMNPRGVAIRYRSLMLPLGRPEGGVGFILGGMRWKSG